VLSIAGMPAAEIAGLLHYDPRTVRRWISRHDAEGVAGSCDRPRCGRPRIGSPRLGQRIAALLATPKAWTVARIWRALGRGEDEPAHLLPAHPRAGPVGPTPMHPRSP